MFKFMSLALIPALVAASDYNPDAKSVGQFIFPSSEDTLVQGESYKVKWKLTDEKVEDQAKLCICVLPPSPRGRRSC